MRGSRPTLVFIIVAAAAMTFTSGAEANHRTKVLCGNFSGQGMDPHLARKPARCDITRRRSVVELRSMRWERWGESALGRGLVNGRLRTVHLRRRRPCGQHGQYDVYSEMMIDRKGFRPILHCGD